MQRGPIAFDATSLDDAVAAFHRRGYRIFYRDATTAQLVKPKRFNTLLALVLALVLAGFGAILYIIYFLGQKEQLVLLALGTSGRVEVIDDGSTREDVLLGYAVIGAGLVILVFVLAIVFGI